MIRNIMRDVLFLNRKSEPATREDIHIGIDLMDTLNANSDRCVGMAANMIGIRKNIIVANTGIGNVVMFNPIIKKRSGEYETMEGCLSLPGERKTKRYKEIEVEYYDMGWKRQKGTFKGFIAQIIQHEVDHLDGILI